MPNHTQNNLHVYGAAGKVAEARALILTYNNEAGEWEVDFHLVKPMPRDLNIISGSVGTTAYAALFGSEDAWNRIIEYPWVPGEVRTRRDLTRFLMAQNDDNSGRFSPSWTAAGEEYHRNISRYGYVSWYEWCTSEWGTKWNAYDCSVVQDEPTHLEVHFNTAWSPPIGVYAALQERVPEATFEAYWADEGCDDFDSVL